MKDNGSKLGGNHMGSQGKDCSSRGGDSYGSYGNRGGIQRICRQLGGKDCMPHSSLRTRRWPQPQPRLQLWRLLSHQLRPRL